MISFDPGRSSRRDLLKLLAGSVGAFAASDLLGAGETITLPFENGTRALVAYPGKRPLMVLTSRPPQLETPFSVFNEGVLTPNDAFFVRYHLANIPTSIDTETFRLTIKGEVNTPLTLTLDDLRKNFEAVETVAVAQCSGNSRGFSQPRVGGGQLANGAMGNARWKGVRLKDVLEKAGVKTSAKQVSFDGLDTAVMPNTPDFVKSLGLPHALNGEILIAYAMNGEDLPMLNGFPIRLVVPGYYSTYWVKHLTEISVLDKDFDGFWVKTAYRIPDTPGACVPPGTAPANTVPINRLNVRSFITSHENGAKVKVGEKVALRGIAFDGGAGIKEVQFSGDGGKSWQSATLGEDLGRFSFREWTLAYQPAAKGSAEWKVRAFNSVGESQPTEALWNPAGYMRNVVETVKVEIA